MIGSTNRPKHRTHRLVRDAEVAGEGTESFPLCSRRDLWPTLLRNGVPFRPDRVTPGSPAPASP